MTFNFKTHDRGIARQVESAIFAIRSTNYVQILFSRKDLNFKTCVFNNIGTLRAITCDRMQGHKKGQQKILETYFHLEVKRKDLSTSCWINDNCGVVNKARTLMAEIA